MITAHPAIPCSSAKVICMFGISSILSSIVRSILHRPRSRADRVYCFAADQPGLGRESSRIIGFFLCTHELLLGGSQGRKAVAAKQTRNRRQSRQIVKKESA